jgi:hypothetical protein
MAKNPDPVPTSVFDPNKKFRFPNNVVLILTKILFTVMALLLGGIVFIDQFWC